MRRKSLWKQAISVMLAMIMLLSLPSQTALAEEMSNIVSTELMETLEVAEIEATEAQIAETEAAEKVTETEADTKEELTENTEIIEQENMEVLTELRNTTAEEDFDYSESEAGMITITGYTGSDTEIVIPEAIDGKSVTCIGNSAFYECGGLTSVELPSSITSIEYAAFEDCSSLTSIEIPAKVANIEGNPFKGCHSLESILVNNENTVYNSGENNNYIAETATNTLVVGCRNSIISTDITAIGDEAFYGCYLEKIKIPSSVTSIGDEVFDGNNNLVIYCDEESYARQYADDKGFLYRSLEKWGSDFDYELNEDGTITIIKYYGSDDEVVIPETIDEKNVTGIGDYALEGYNGLTSIVIPASIIKIGNNPFARCENLESITVAAENLNYSSDENNTCIIENETNTLIAGCKNTIIPTTIKSIGYSAFYGCKDLTSIEIPDGVTSIGDLAFDSCYGLTNIYFPSSITNIGYRAFSGCVGLINIELPSNVMKIEYSAFEGCNNLVSIKIPAKVETIEGNPFQGCQSLESIIVDKENTIYNSGENNNYIAETATNTLVAVCKNTIIPTNITNIGEEAFRGYSGSTELEIPESVISIGTRAFYGCCLKKIKIPTSVTNIGYEAFGECGNIVVFCDEDSYVKQYVVDNDIPYKSLEKWNSDFDYETNEDGTITIIKYYGNNTEVIIPETIDEKKVTAIGNEGFKEYEGLTSIKIPSSVTSIGDYTFYDCGSLNDVELPESLASIGDYAFYDCNGLIRIELPEGLTNIGDYTFYYCQNLKFIKIPSSVTSIGNGAFDGSDNLIIYCDEDSYARQYAIDNGISYKSLGMWNSDFDCDYTVNEDGTITITAYTGSATEVVVPETIDGKSVTGIGDNAFEGCNSLTSIVLPESLTSIGYYVFRNCSNLTTIKIPKNVTDIGRFSFSGCNRLESIIVDSENTVFNSGTNNNNCIIKTATNTLLAGCKNTVIPENVTFIEYGAFKECSSLSSIVIPENITELDNEVFYGCSGLKELVIPANVENIGFGAFSECSSLTRVEISMGVGSIEGQAFYGCSSLTNIEIPTSVSYIGSYAFADCGNLTSIRIFSNVKRIGEGVFDGCSNLTIYCPEGSYAEQYAIDNDIPYSLIEEQTVCTHINTELRNKKNATCTVAGYTGDTYCKDCGILVSKGTATAVLGHSYTGKVTKAATVNAEGVMTYTCSRCGHTYTKSIAKLTCTYTVRFSGNNADSGSMTDQSITYGSGSILRANTFQKKGYTFKNWNTKADGSGISLVNKADGSKLTQTAGAVVTLYAQWTKTKYSISYNLNNGTNSKDNPSSYDIKTNTITLKDASRKGYTFNGWYTDKNYKKRITQIKKGSTGNITLYAKWTVNSYTIIFDGNGSTSGSMKKLSGCKYGKTYTLTKNGFKKKGYTFKGWRTSKNGDGKLYKNQAEIKNLSAKSGGKVTLYAQWSKTKYTITYKLNKGTNSKSNPSSYTITTKTIKLKNPTRKGYTFKGWYSDKKCTKKVTQIKKGSTGNITLYAKWVKKK